jgi:uncharacterized protein (TIGR03435 family)
MISSVVPFKLVGLLAVSTLGAIAAQAQEFEAVSLKPSDGVEMSIASNGLPASTRRLGLTFTPGRVIGTETLLGYIREAYSVKAWQVSGPGWLGSDSFAIVATTPVETATTNARLMLRAMLRERFHLSLHEEEKSTPVYVLVVDRRSQALVEVIPNPGHYSFDSAAGSYTATAVPMRSFAEHLGRVADRPVIDQTGLSGAYSFSLKWAPEFEARTGGGTRDRGILEAIRQLGFRLEKKDLPQKILVVDSADRRPTAN